MAKNDEAGVGGCEAGLTEIGLGNLLV